MGRSRDLGECFEALRVTVCVCLRVRACVCVCVYVCALLVPSLGWGTYIRESQQCRLATVCACGCVCAVRACVCFRRIEEHWDVADVHNMHPKSTLHTPCRKKV